MEGKYNLTYLPHCWRRWFNILARVGITNKREKHVILLNKYSCNEVCASCGQETVLYFKFVLMVCFNWKGYNIFCPLSDCWDGMWNVLHISVLLTVFKNIFALIVSVHEMDGNFCTFVIIPIYMGPKNWFCSKLISWKSRETELCCICFFFLR